MSRISLILPYLGLLVALQLGSSTTVLAGTDAPWVESYNSKVRLLAGSSAERSGAPAQAIAGVEIQMAPGWKTYWRMPGDAGGVPPHFDWSASENLAEAKVLYPAPHRQTDPTGDSIGYSKSVVFPVMVTAKDPNRPVELRLAVSYGICREICVPAEANLALSVPPTTMSLPEEIKAALEVVPRDKAARRAKDPVLAKVEATLTGDKPKIVLEASFPGGSQAADLFVEAPGDLYLPVPAKTSEREGWARFEINLGDGTEPAALKGKTLLATIVSEAGQSEVAFTVE